jgi:hydrogenase maturation protein HypF
MAKDRAFPEAAGPRLCPPGKAVLITVGGVVQGVGFRPFIHRLAARFAYKGWVKNIGSGVEIHFESTRKTDFAAFFTALEEDKPPLVRVESLEVRPARFKGFSSFHIKKSEEGESFVFISPDIATCGPCRTEIGDPAERRHRYPFTNCTDCGPRYTIVRSLPYDRPKTTMAGFEMCPDCRREYEDPDDRRYHAQPIACPVCGPRVTLKEARSGRRLPGGIEAAAELIGRGKILAIKGLGGFHLVCDPRNAAAVRRLRVIKERKRKPLALMARDIRTVERFAFVGPAERRALLSPSRPIVLLRKKKDIPGVAPHLDETGFMLPYTPLHHLLLEKIDLIVATSSNLKDAPISKDESEGIARLCDFILTHDRPIQTRADDSVMKVAGDGPLFLRRARGYVPYPQRIPADLDVPAQVLALGGELKDTVSVYKKGYVITSQFLGDLDEYRNFRYFEETIAHLEKLFDVKPDVVVSDLHPQFRTTRHAENLGLPHFKVQHHYAHVLAVMLEHQVPDGQKVLGVSLDGYGYGVDGGAWGGEFLLSDYSSFTRAAHFKPVPLPGGDLAAREPWRMALSYLRDAYGEEIPYLPSLRRVSRRSRDTVMKMMASGMRSPLTSSCGRLFDAVSSIAGLAPVEVEFEAEAPMRLEAVSRDAAGVGYPFEWLTGSDPWQLSFAPAIREIVREVRRNVPAGRIGASFHLTLAEAIASAAGRVRDVHGVDTVALVGGVFLNRTLLSMTMKILQKKGFQVLRPLLYSPNDESISIGQVAHALARLKKESI